MLIGLIKGSVILFSLIPLASLMRAQSNPALPNHDLSGTWMLDVKKSNKVGVKSRPSQTITISHRDPEFRIVLKAESNGQVIEREFVYFTDVI
jgi:hypothetical protein